MRTVAPATPTSAAIDPRLPTPHQACSTKLPQNRTRAGQRTRTHWFSRVAEKLQSSYRIVRTKAESLVINTPMLSYTKLASKWSQPRYLKPECLRRQKQQPQHCRVFSRSFHSLWCRALRLCAQRRKCRPRFEKIKHRKYQQSRQTLPCLSFVPGPSGAKLLFRSTTVIMGGRKVSLQASWQLYPDRSFDTSADPAAIT